MDKDKNWQSATELHKILNDSVSCETKPIKTEPLLTLNDSVSHETEPSTSNKESYARTLRKYRQMKYAGTNNKIQQREYEFTQNIYNCLPCRIKMHSSNEFTLHFQSCKFGYLQTFFFPCEQCDKAFPKKHSLEKHRETVHAVPKTIETKPFPCDLCGKEFKKQRILNFHISTHKELWQSCGVCKRPFRKSFDLAKHLLTHDNKLPYFCLNCKLGFTEKNEWKKHKKTHRIGNPKVHR